MPKENDSKVGAWLEGALLAGREHLSTLALPGIGVSPTSLCQQEVGLGASGGGGAAGVSPHLAGRRKSRFKVPELH